ncbi:molybdate ABC transporter substrate-binding protein [Nereida sp.]|uniref:molybdate ABC transporter substrate-binding protein n=1 Tax=Nereida sp. TaxID=2736090 RepID=UPI003F695452
MSVATSLRAEQITVFAASSLKPVFDKLVPLYEAETGGRVSVSFAGTATNVRQIQQGAQADVFVSANIAWADALQSDESLVVQARAVIAKNRLVLVSATQLGSLALDDGQQWNAALGGGRLAIGLTQAVPAGIYARQALERLNVWAATQDKLVEASSVQGVLNFVRRGEVPLGIVYLTDALSITEGVYQVALFDKNLHDSIEYPALALTQAGSGFVEFLQRPATQKILLEMGFESP